MDDTWLEHSVVAVASIGSFNGDRVLPGRTVLAPLTATSWTYATVVGAIGLLTTALVPMGRCLVREICSRFNACLQPVLVLGHVADAEIVCEKIKADRRCGLRPLGLIVSANRWLEEDESPWCLGSTEDVVELASKYGVYWAVIVARTGEADRAEAAEFENCLTRIPHRLHIDPAHVYLESPRRDRQGRKLADQQLEDTQVVEQQLVDTRLQEQV